MRLRFTIRDLLWLTLMVALVVGWYFDKRKSMREYGQQIQSLKGDVKYAEQQVKHAEQQEELWLSKLRLKIIGTPEEESLPKPKPLEQNGYPNPGPVPIGLRPTTG